MMKEITKYAIASVGALAIVGTAMLIAPPREEQVFGGAIEDKLAAIATSQAAYYASNGKYQYVARTTDGDYDYGQTEYTDPDNGYGYQVLVWDVGATSTMIKSYGYGPQAIDRTYDWRLVEPEPN